MASKSLTTLRVGTAVFRGVRVMLAMLCAAVCVAVSTDSVQAESDGQGAYAFTQGAYRFKLGGYVKVDAIHDFSPIGNEKLFVPRTIPVPDTIGNFPGRTVIFANRRPNTR